jgi:gliding motility-associated-like protein
VQSFTVTQPNAALSASGIVTNVKCFGDNSGAITLTVTGGTAPYTFAWSNSTSTKDVNGLSAGNYTVTVRDANNCSAVQSFTVAQPTQPLNSKSFKTDVTCFDAKNGSARVNISGGTPPYQYRWNIGNNNANANNLTAGKYFVTVFDVNGCVIRDTIQINQPDNITFSVTKNDVLCYGEKTGSATINVSGGVAPYSFLWSNNEKNASIQQVPSGSYQVTITDFNGCTKTTSAIINSPSILTLSLQKTDNICFEGSSGSIQSFASGGSAPYIFEWSNNAFTSNISNLVNGLYTLTVTDKNGCSTTQSTQISSPTKLTASISVSGKNACENTLNANAIAQVNGGLAPYSYRWQNGFTGNEITNIPPNTPLQVSIKDKNGCVIIASDTVKAVQPLLLSISAKEIGCQNNSKGYAVVEVSGGSAPLKFTWSNGNKTNEIFPTQAGKYSVTVSDKNGCSATAAVEISQTQGFSIRTIASQTIKLGESIELTTTASANNIQTWKWQPDDFNSGLDCSSCQSPNAEPKKTTTYWVKAIDENGCVANDSVTINVIADHTLYIPNTFSPNNDGSNDTWGIFGNLEGIKEYDVKIFNRWGEKVFESSDPHFQWNGTYKGVLQDPGVFVYYMKVIFVDGLKPDDDGKGSITLIR